MCNILHCVCLLHYRNRTTAVSGRRGLTYYNYKDVSRTTECELAHVFYFKGPPRLTAVREDLTSDLSDFGNYDSDVWSN